MTERKYICALKKIQIEVETIKLAELIYIEYIYNGHITIDDIEYIYNTVNDSVYLSTREIRRVKDRALDIVKNKYHLEIK